MTEPLEATELIERKGDNKIAFGFITLICVLAAWRGRDGAPVIAGLFAIGAVASAGFGIYLARQPGLVLRVTRDTIMLSSTDQELSRIDRRPTTRLSFFKLADPAAPWILIGGEGPGIILQGYHPAAVGKACTDHGWEFSSPEPFTW